MAGLGKKDFQPAEILTAADVNGYLMDQTIMRFADASARTAAIGTPTEGMFTYLDSDNSLSFWDGSAWVVAGALDATPTLAGKVFGLTENSGNFRTALGADASTASLNDVAIGYNANASGGALAIGANSVALQGNSVAIGTNVESRGPGIIAIGNNIDNIYEDSIVIGDNAANNGGGTRSITIGADANDGNAYDDTITIGTFADSVGLQTVAIGNFSVANSGATALGFEAEGNGGSSTSIGDNAQANGQNSVSIGRFSFNNSQDAIAIGTSSGSTNFRAISLGAISSASGFGSTVAGYDASTSGMRSTSLGYEAQSTTDNTITLGHTTITSLRCNVQTISSLSDERDKTDIQDTTLGLDLVKKLRPVDFTWNRRDGSMGNAPDIGFIAQEVAQVEDELGVADRLRMTDRQDPDAMLLAQGRLVPALTKAIQELSAKNDELEARLAKLEGK